MTEPTWPEPAQSAILRDLGRLDAITQVLMRRSEAQPQELAAVEARLDGKQLAAETRQIEAIARVDKHLSAAIERLSDNLDAWRAAAEGATKDLLERLAQERAQAAQRVDAAEARLKAVEVEQAIRPRETLAGWGRVERLLTLVVLGVAMALFGGDGAARLINLLKMLGGGSP